MIDAYNDSREAGTKGPREQGKRKNVGGEKGSEADVAGEQTTGPMSGARSLLAFGADLFHTCELNHVFGMSRNATHTAL